MPVSRSLASITSWDKKTDDNFCRLLLKFRNTPSTTNFVNSLIKFEDVYEPLKITLSTVLKFRDIDGFNEYRRFQRSRIYLGKKDLVRTVDSRGGKSLVVTSRGRRIFYETYPLAKLRREKWDGLWTILAYDFPKSHNQERNYFRSKIKDLGFGSPQESLYISPLPISKPLLELIEGEQFKDFVWVVTAGRVLGVGNKEISEKSWRLRSLNSLYEKLLEALPKVKQLGDVGLRNSWSEHFLALDNVDPYLPAELLPDYWKGEICRREFQKLSQFNLPDLLKSIFRR